MASPQDDLTWKIFIALLIALIALTYILEPLLNAGAVAAIVDDASGASVAESLVDMANSETARISRFAGWGMADLLSNGFLLEGLSDDPWTAGCVELAACFQTIRPSAFFDMPVLSLMTSYWMLHSISAPFYTTAIEEVDKSCVGRKISLNKEINMMGVSNMIVA